MNIVNDILVNTLFPDTDFVQTLDMDSVVPKYVENQEKGNPSVCKNCAEAPFRDLHIYGRSEQVTTTGAQLLDIPDYTGISRGVTVTVKEGLISLHGTCTETGWVLIEQVTPVSLDGMYVLSVYGASQRATLITENYSAIIESTSVKVVNNMIAKKLSFSAEKGEVLNVDGIKVMLNAGDTALPWEPYTGGKPSPSPDYPQEIVSAGEDGSIGVEVHGKNILGERYYYANYSNGVLFVSKDRKDEEVKFPYTPKYESFGVCKVIKCKKGKTYVISVTNPNKNATIGMAEYENIENAFVYTNNVGFVKMSNKTKLYTAKSDGILVCGIAGTWTDGKTTTHECTESELLQVEEASESTSYEPYHEPQSMSVTTPNGLPGIPVSSGGNYTDENGQQWICDEVDLGRGVYAQRVDKGAFDATKALTEQSVILATPIENPLTTAEIAAYKSLRTYKGTTIVEAEDKAGISVKYNMPMPELSKNGALRRWFKRHPII